MRQNSSSFIALENSIIRVTDAAVEVVRRLFHLLSAMVGAAMFLLGAGMALVSAFFLGVIPVLGYLETGRFVLPYDSKSLAMMMAVGVAIAVGGAALTRFCFKQIKKWLSKP